MIEECKLISLPKIYDPRGNLTFIEGSRNIPFDIRRVYYFYNVPENAQRGGHAHKELHQLIVAISGAFDVSLSDGKHTKKFHLDSPTQGLYVCPMIWRDLYNFSDKSIGMVLASNYYDEEDYYRDYNEFRNVVIKYC